MTLEEVYKAIKRKIISVGVLPTIRLIITRSVDKIFSRETVLFYIDIPSYSLNQQEISKHIIGKEIKSFMDLSSKDISSIRDYVGEKYIAESKRRFANNWRLFLAYINDKLAGACWTVTNTSDLKTKVVPLLEGDVALIDGWTVPSFRGRNVYPFILSFIVNQFKEKNFKRAFGYGDTWNISALKGLKKGGFRDFIIYESYIIFGNEVVIWKPASRKKVSYS
jgi:hypothetical protein